MTNTSFSLSLAAYEAATQYATGSLEGQKKFLETKKTLEDHYKNDLGAYVSDVSNFFISFQPNSRPAASEFSTSSTIDNFAVGLLRDVAPTWHYVASPNERVDIVDPKKYNAKIETSPWGEHNVMGTNYKPDEVSHIKDAYNHFMDCIESVVRDQNGEMKSSINVIASEEANNLRIAAIRLSGRNNTAIINPKKPGMKS